MELPTIVAQKLHRKVGGMGYGHRKRARGEAYSTVLGVEWTENLHAFLGVASTVEQLQRECLVAVWSFVIVALLDRDDHVDY